MRKLITILTFTALSLSGAIWAQQPPRRRDQRTQEREQRTRRQERKEAKSDTLRGAILRFEEHTHDFGDIARKGGDLVYDFRLRNEGDTPLVLTRVTTTCSCLKGSFSKRPIPPGGESTLRITYEPHKSEEGIFNKVIRVSSNSAEGIVLVTVQGNSIDEKDRERITRTQRKTK